MGQNCCGEHRSSIDLSQEYSLDTQGNKLNKQTESVEIHLQDNPIQKDYKFGSILGEGAFACVRQVKSKATDIIRAMKILKKKSGSDEAADAIQEAKMLKSLDHPNIIQIIETYQDSYNFYIIQELCQGGELFDKIQELDHFSEKLAANYMKQLLSAVIYIHDNNLVHRDIKPENLMLTTKKDEATIKLIDFGTCTKFSKKKKLSKRIGTPYYIAPEVLQKSYDEKCDVWSCGVILYILLCGYPPFNGMNDSQILQSISKGSLQFDEKDWRNVSPEAKDLIKAMLAKNPQERLSAKQAFQHVWIQDNSQTAKLSPKILQNMGQFQGRNKIKQSVLKFIATQVLTQQEKEKLLQTFQNLDKDGSGTLSRDELLQGYTEITKNINEAESLVDRILIEVDYDNSGNIDFQEFLTAAINQEMLQQSKLKQTFHLIDRDGNGYIDRSELEQILGGIVIDDKLWGEILEQCDENKDGKIQYDEFIGLLRKNKQTIDVKIAQ